MPKLMPTQLIKLPLMLGGPLMFITPLSTHVLPLLMVLSALQLVELLDALTLPHAHQPLTGTSFQKLLLLMLLSAMLPPQHLPAMALVTMPPLALKKKEPLVPLGSPNLQLRAVMKLQLRMHPMMTGVPCLPSACMMPLRMIALMTLAAPKSMLLTDFHKHIAAKLALLDTPSPTGRTQQVL